MSRATNCSTKSKKLTAWQIFTNNGRFDSALPPNRRNIQRRINFNQTRAVSTNPTQSSQLNKDRCLSSVKTRTKIVPSVLSVNSIKINEQENAQINLNISPTPNEDQESLVKPRLRLRLYSKTENSNKLTSQSKESQQRKATHLFENISELSRECAICLLDQPESFYDKCYSSKCEHSVRRICDKCLYNHIKILVENIVNNNNNNIFCPEPDCSSQFTFENIRYILNMENNFELFERYDRQLTYRHLEENQEFVWCAHIGCGSGQFHDMSLNANPMLICIKCKKRTCAHHRIVWHIGMTCQQYDQSKSLSDEQNTQVWLDKHSKKCPKCQTYIEKISGCDHMICKRCKHQFCWECFADYQQIQIYGLTKHKNYCNHYPSYRRNNNSSSRQRSTMCNIL